MPNHPWLEALRADLLRQGLPAGYVARFVQELNDHIADLFLEQEGVMHTEVRGTNTALPGGLEERLGSREQLTDQAVAEYRRARLTARHPILMFLLAPIPAALAFYPLFFFLAWLASEGFAFVLGYGWGLIGKPAAEWPEAFVWAVRNVHVVSRFLPPATVVLLWCRLSLRSGRGRRWGMASCLVIAVIAGLYVTQLELPTADAKGRLVIGIGFGLTSSVLQQIVQFLLPLSLGGYLLLRAHPGSEALSLDKGP